MSTKDVERAKAQVASSQLQLLYNYGAIFLWIFLSATVIFINKFVLSYSGFPFPIALTVCHMLFCSLVAAVVVHSGYVEAPVIDTRTYINAVLPIAILFSGTLWLGNAAYLYLSVAFIQMLKAAMPITVFVVGVFLGNELFELNFVTNLLVIGFGVAAASYGELNFNALGVTLQAGAIVTESFRLALVQILLQKRGIKLNPITSLYFISPACFLCLILPFAFLELPKIMTDPNVVINIPLLLLSCIAAFALNLSVFLLIGRTSALTMNVAGVIKDWLLIFLSVALYKSIVTQTQYAGYFVAFLGVCWYNYQKLHKPAADSSKGGAAAAKPAPPEAGPPDADTDELKMPLLVSENSSERVKLASERMQGSPAQRLHSRD